MITDIVFAASYTVADTGTALLDNVEFQEVLLPTIDHKWLLSTDAEAASLPDRQDTNKSVQRKGKGAHTLTIAKKLLSDRTNWYNIESSDDYNFPGIFAKPFSQRLGYCEDVSKLPNYEPSDPHFLYSDIQIGKGKARPKRIIEVKIVGNMKRFTIDLLLVVVLNDVQCTQMGVLMLYPPMR